MLRYQLIVTLMDISDTWKVDLLTSLYCGNLLFYIRSVDLAKKTGLSVTPYVRGSFSYQYGK